MYNEISSNKRKSAFILVAFAVFACIIAYVASWLLGAKSFAPYVIIAALSYVVISYYAGSKLASALNGAKEVGRQDEQRLYRIVENLAITDGLPMPKVYVMEDPGLNAFAMGRNPNNAIVCATRGLLDTMTDSEVQGVMAHELAHVKNYDVRVSLVAFAMASIIGIISDIVLRAMFWGGGDDDQNNPVMMIIGIIAIILAPIVAAMIQMAISRKREYLADASGALTTRYPEGLTSALEKIEQKGSTLKKQNSSTAHIFFANPLKKKSLSRLFSTHPPIEDRIAKLRQMGSGK
jgi:heat shock protein HtpX